jgi:hypothetical protein
MFLILYDIETKKDPHGIRVRLVRKLHQSGAFQFQRSAWLLEKCNGELLKVIDEFRCAGGSVKILEWLPRTMEEFSGKASQIKSYALAIMGAEPILEGLPEKIAHILENLGGKVVLQPVGESALSEFYKRMGNLRRIFSQENKSISRMLDEISLLDVDGIIMLNCGRSTQSGIAFGAQAIANTKFMKNMTSLPLIQIERAGKSDGVLIVWNESGSPLGKEISRELSLAIITPSLETKRVTEEGGREVRQIHFAKTGDSIIVGGVKVGVCLTDQVYLVAEKGRLVDIMGGKLMKNASRKVSFESLSKVVVKTLTPD